MNQNNIAYHALLIGFNVVTKFYGKYDDEIWLRNRIEIFEKLTLKSIQNQTNKNFDCFLFFCDSLIPNDLRDRIYSWENMKPIFLGDEPVSAAKDYIPLIKENMKDSKNIITTSVDNDDLIHKDLVDIIQKNLSNTRKAVYLKRGYTYVDGNDFLYKVSWPTNSIFTLYEPASNITTCRISESHKDFFKEHKNITSNISTKERMWIQYLHNNNSLEAYNKQISSLSEEEKNIEKQKRKSKLSEHTKKILDFSEGSEEEHSEELLKSDFGVSFDDFYKLEKI